MRLRASPANTSGGTSRSVASAVRARRRRASRAAARRGARASCRGSTAACGTASLAQGPAVLTGTRSARRRRGGCSMRTPAHLVELALRRGLLREQGGLDAVEQTLEPADELGLGEAQLRLGRCLAGEREDDLVELLLEIGGEDALELLERPLVDLGQTAATGIVERGPADLVEHGAHHRGDADELGGARDLLAASSAASSPRPRRASAAQARRGPSSTSSGWTARARVARVGPSCMASRLGGAVGGAGHRIRRGPGAGACDHAGFRSPRGQRAGAAVGNGDVPVHRSRGLHPALGAAPGRDGAGAGTPRRPAPRCGRGAGARW